MQRINAEYDELKKHVGNIHETADGRTYTREEAADVPDNFRAIINAIITFDCTIELCGSWLWPAPHIMRETLLMKRKSLC